MAGPSNGPITSVAHTRFVSAKLLLREFQEGLVYKVEEILRIGFFFGSAALIVLEVAQGRFGISLRTEEAVTLPRCLIFPLRRLSIH